MSNPFDKRSPFKSTLDAIANWVTRYRPAVGLTRELAKCGPEEVAAIARDIGLSTEELEFIASKGRNAADELPRLLRALGVDPQKIGSDRTKALRDLQRICISCSQTAQCRHELAVGPPQTTIRTIVQTLCSPPQICAPRSVPPELTTSIPPS
jgi:hypothetical protein